MQALQFLLKLRMVSISSSLSLKSKTWKGEFENILWRAILGGTGCLHLFLHGVSCYLQFPLWWSILPLCWMHRNFSPKLIIYQHCIYCQRVLPTFHHPVYFRPESWPQWSKNDNGGQCRGLAGTCRCYIQKGATTAMKAVISMSGLPEDHTGPCRMTVL